MFAMGTATRDVTLAATTAVSTAAISNVQCACYGRSDIGSSGFHVPTAGKVNGVAGHTGTTVRPINLCR